MATFTSTELEVFDSSRTLAYPSANAINGGEFNTEENIRNIVTRISAKSFVLKRVISKETSKYAVANNTFEIKVSSTVSSQLIVNPGEANIRGYYFRSRIPTNIDLNSYLTDADSALYKLYNNIDDAWPNASEGVYPPFTMYVYLNVQQDSAKHILAYDVTDTNVQYTPFRGVVVALTTTKSDDNDLLLGSFTLNRESTGFSITNVQPDENRFTFLDANDIFVYDSDTHEFLTLEQIVKLYIKDVTINEINENLYVYGPTTGSTNTCIYLTNQNKDMLFKLYFDEDSAIGGLALYEASVVDDQIVEGTLKKSLFSFTSLPVSGVIDNSKLVIGTITEVAESLKVNGNFTALSNATINGDTTFGSTGSNVTTINGSIVINKSDPNDTSVPTSINDTTITAKEVYGAVWG